MPWHWHRLSLEHVATDPPEALLLVAVVALVAAIALHRVRRRA